MILNSSLPMAILVGKDGVTIYNDAYAQLIGKRHPKTLGGKASECWPETAALSDQAIEAARCGERLRFRDLELTVYRTGRPEQIWVNVDCSPVPDEDGRPLGVLSITTETTERVLAERAAKQEIARLRQVFEQAPAFICLMTGPTLIVEYVNEAHRRLFGDRRPEGRPYVEAFRDIVQEGDPEILFKAYATGETYIARADLVRVPRPDGRIEEHFLDIIVAPARDHAGVVTGLYVEGFDVTPQVRAQEAAAENERRLSAAVSIARLGAFEWNLETDAATLDARAREIYGFGPEETLRVSEVVKRIDPEDRVRVRAESRDAVACGQTRREFEYRIHLPDGSVRDIAAISDTVLGPTGQVQRIAGVFDDVTERRRAEKRQRLLINELNHRVKNTLATVQSIAAQTLHSAPDLARAREAFEARLIALAGAHDLLTTESWHGARLTDVVARAMAPFETAQQPQISRSGPPVWLTARRALALSMALHELATNAVKYGALSGLEGHVTILWRLSADDQLTLFWVEQGGPPVKAPERFGFGSRLLQRSLAHELDGEVAFTFAPDGVRCTIQFQLEPLSTSAEPAMLQGLGPSGPESA
ncbi:PAS domain S-box protein [Phenylobacterium sp. LjRoot225]|uniref:sensor histidine kinase n=1 Tax=Phenylobacterium sp. LjRoot225 TaxID=3342285 RepID=UPI003ECC3A6F